MKHKPISPLHYNVPQSMIPGPYNLPERMPEYHHLPAVSPGHLNIGERQSQQQTPQVAQAQQRIPQVGQQQQQPQGQNMHISPEQYVQLLAQFIPQIGQQQQRQMMPNQMFNMNQQQQIPQMTQQQQVPLWSQQQIPLISQQQQVPLWNQQQIPQMSQQQLLAQLHPQVRQAIINQLQLQQMQRIPQQVQLNPQLLNQYQQMLANPQLLNQSQFQQLPINTQFMNQGQFVPQQQLQSSQLGQYQNMQVKPEDIPKWLLIALGIPQVDQQHAPLLLHQGRAPMPVPTPQVFNLAHRGMQQQPFARN